MKQYTLTFANRDTLPEELEQVADDIGITTEQLIKRFIAAGLAAHTVDSGPVIAGETLEDFFVKNGIWK